MPRAPPEKILGQLGWLVRTKFPMIAPGGLAPGRSTQCFRTDLDLKRSAGDPRVLLERLVVELCAGRGGVRQGCDQLRRFRLARRTRVCDPRLVAACRVAVNDALARHPVDEAKSSASSAVFAPAQIVAVDSRADAFERATQPRAGDWRLRSRFLRLCLCAFSAVTCVSHVISAS